MPSTPPSREKERDALQLPELDQHQTMQRLQSSKSASSSAAPVASKQQEPSASSAVAQQAVPVFEQLAVVDQDDGTKRLPVDKLEDFIVQVTGSTSDYSALQRSVTTPSTKERGLTLEASVALAGMVISTTPHSSGPGSPTGSSAASSVAKAPFKKLLKSRYYLESGNLAYDTAVITYIQKLNEHRLKCESDGRYGEAQAAARRLADLKTAQVERLRQELMESQRREQEELQKVYEEESSKFQKLWDRRIKEYESGFAKAVEDLKKVHADQREIHAQELRTKAFRPKPSKEYLNQKRIEESLAKSRQYSQASRVRKATDELYQAECEQALQIYEADQKLKLAKFAAKQQQEVEALLQRGARGRDELELRRAAETERRTYRYRNILSELESLNKLEVVHLENFLDGQVQAGKAVPLRDGFRRRREQLLSTEF